MPSTAERATRAGFAKTPMSAYASRAMPSTTNKRSAALGRVCRLVLAARRHGQPALELEAVELALVGLDVDGLAEPRPIGQMCNVGRTVGVAARA